MMDVEPNSNSSNGHQQQQQHQNNTTANNGHSGTAANHHRHPPSSSQQLQHFHHQHRHQKSTSTAMRLKQSAPPPSSAAIQPKTPTTSASSSNNDAPANAVASNPNNGSIAIVPPPMVRRKIAPAPPIPTPSTSKAPKSAPVAPAATAAATMCQANISQFAIETYFIWFSALIFLTELIVDVWLAALYFQHNHPLWGLATAAIIVVPLGLCQMYSLWLLRTDNYPIRASALGMHITLLGIPYRYYGILRRVEHDKLLNGGAANLAERGGEFGDRPTSSADSVWAIKHQINDANAIQTMNATFQYCPQFLFQSFLIVYRKYKCILTGVSAGLAGFAFLWHIFIHFYYLLKPYNENDDAERPGIDCYEHRAGQRQAAAVGQTPHIIDNLSSGPQASNGGTASQAQQQPINNNHLNASSSAAGAFQHGADASTTSAYLHGHANANNVSGPSSLVSNHHSSQTSASLTDSLRNFEKPQYKTDDNNLMSKRGCSSKMVEKNKIFGFNKRRPIYQQQTNDDLGDMMLNESGVSAGAAAAANMSTIFFEIDDSRLSQQQADVSGVSSTAMGGKLNASMLSNSKDNFLNENFSNAATMLAKKALNDYNKYKFGGTTTTTNVDSSMLMLCGDGASGAVGCDDDTSAMLDEMDELKREKMLLSGGGAAAATNSAPLNAAQPGAEMMLFGNRNSLLKRKGICSSQEMLHLVDIMNEHISAEQVDVLAKSLVELGDVSLSPSENADEDRLAQPTNAAKASGGNRASSSGHDMQQLDNTQLLLDHFPPRLHDERLLENIDAAIYENQIIFQERIRKNQLTIQNLKLQDQLLSKCIEDMKNAGADISSAVAAAAAAIAGGGSIRLGSEAMSIRDYENMCFTNISRQQRGMKHWRNYFQDMDTSAHDSSTVQHSSYYVNTNTMSNSTTDLYMNADDGGVEDDGGASTVIIHDDDDEDDDGKGTNSAGSVSSSALGIVTKRGARWSSKLSARPPPKRVRTLQPPAPFAMAGGRSTGSTANGRDSNEQPMSVSETVVSDDLYIDMHNPDDGVASAISMDASTTTTRGSNSSVVVELDEDDRDEDNDDDCSDRCAVRSMVGMALPQKNILVETINKINVDSPVKSLLGGLMAGGVGVGGIIGNGSAKV